jgi:hypothetical protein
METAVKRPTESTNKVLVNDDRPELVTTQLAPVTSIPVHDYRPALQNAVSWLGDRYLLAEPVTRRNEERKPYFVEARRWHPVTRH